jgi:hypothetical protein
MNRLATVRSRRMMLYAVCCVAVVLGALGKSMIDGLSAPDINVDTAMVSDTASPATPVASNRPGLGTPSSVPSAPIISRPSSNERSLPDTQPCSAHSTSSACAHRSAQLAMHASRTSHSSHQAQHASTIRTDAASANRTTTSSAREAGTHATRNEHKALYASAPYRREDDHH